MKPRIYRRRGLWYCVGGIASSILGAGDTPALAFESWKRWQPDPNQVARLVLAYA